MVSVIFRGFSLISGVFPRSLAVIRCVFLFVLESFWPVGWYFVCLWMIDVSPESEMSVQSIVFSSFNCNKRPSSLHWNVCCVCVLVGFWVWRLPTHSFAKVIPECFLINDQQVLSVLVNICEPARPPGSPSGCACFSLPLSSLTDNVVFLNSAASSSSVHLCTVLQRL